MIEYITLGSQRSSVEEHYSVYYKVSLG